jgi:hypothetical protein
LRLRELEITLPVLEVLKSRACDRDPLRAYTLDGGGAYLAHFPNHGGLPRCYGVLQTIRRLLVRSKCFRREWPGGVPTPRTSAFDKLIGMAKLNDIESESYLRYILAHVADHPITGIDELLPWNLADQLRPQQKIAA